MSVGENAVKTLTHNDKRRERMNAHAQALRARKKEMPLFESPWVALFLLLRRELSQPRSTQ